MRLRQVAFAARDLDAVVADLCTVLGIEVAFNDPAVGIFGLRNAVMPAGDTFLEVVSPIETDTAAGRYMARRGGDCGYMVLVQVDDTDAARRRAAALGVRVAWSIDLDDIRGTHFHPRDLGGALLSVDTPVPAAAWRWAGPEWEQHICTDVIRELVGVEIDCRDPNAVAARWAALLDRPLRTTDGGTAEIALDRGRIRFTDSAGREDGVTAIDFTVADRARLFASAAARGLPVDGDAVVCCGTRLRLV